MAFCWYELSISYCLRDIPHLRFRLVTLTFQGHQRSNISLFGKPIWNFIVTLCWYELSISYRWRDIPHLRFRFVTLTFQGHRRSNTSPFWEADMGLYNNLPLIRTLYLVPFARYSTSKISVSDLDLSGSPKVKCITFLGIRYGTL